MLSLDRAIEDIYYVGDIEKVSRQQNVNKELNRVKRVERERRRNSDFTFYFSIIVIHFKLIREKGSPASSSHPHRKFPFNVLARDKASAKI